MRAGAAYIAERSRIARKGSEREKWERDEGEWVREQRSARKREEVAGEQRKEWNVREGNNGVIVIRRSSSESEVGSEPEVEIRTEDRPKIPKCIPKWCGAVSEVMTHREWISAEVPK